MLFWITIVVILILITILIALIIRQAVKDKSTNDCSTTNFSESICSCHEKYDAIDKHP